MIDICNNCNGIWFASGKLASYLDHLVINDKDIADTKIKIAKPIAENEIKETPKYCPRCDNLMNLVNYSYDSNIIIDKCRNCGGVWVDRGDINRLASYTKSNPKISELGEAICNEYKNSKKQREFFDGLADLFAISGPKVLAFLPKIVLPLKSSIKSKTFPIIVIAIIAFNWIVFFYQSLFIKDLQSFYIRYGMIPYLISNGSEHFSLVTSLFLHGSFIHLIGNMIFFWIFGCIVEDTLGHTLFLFYYLILGISASLAHIIFNLDSQIPTIGASGAISGILGTYFVLYPYANIKVFYFYKLIDIPAILFLIMWILVQFLFGFLILSSGSSTGTAWFAHIGGFFIGILLAYFYKWNRWLTSKRSIT